MQGTKGVERREELAVFSVKSAQAQACHRGLTTGAVLLKVSPPDRADPMLADSGCNQSIYPTSYSKHIAGTIEGKDTKVLLAGKDQELIAGPKCMLHIPVKDVQGNVRYMKEVAVLSDDARCPMLGCMHKPLKLGIPGERVQVKDIDDNDFWAAITRGGNGMPVVVPIDEGGVALAGVTKDKGNEDKASDLRSHHLRLGHATGRRLYLSLKEKGVDTFTEKECHEVDCDVCRIMNPKKSKIPRVQDSLRSLLKPGEEAYQDLAHMPKGIGNSRYVSIIIDAFSRKAAGMALKSKDEAILHCISYVRKLQKEDKQVKEWNSDNGGEFANAY